MKTEVNLTHPFLQAFEGDIEPVRVGWSYRIALVLTAFAILLLPLVYIALVAGIAYATYWHATKFSTPWLSGLPPIPIFWYAIYVAMILIGVLLLLFMIKPLFMSAREPNLALQLDPARQPLLFAFVKTIAQRVRAPVPRYIEVTDEMIVTASFHRDWIGFLRNDLMLTISMPMVAAFNLQQFAGALAHELGHFAQGTGMRFFYVIGHVIDWFGRVIFERDAMDIWLKRMTKEGHIFIPVFFVSYLCISMTRKILLPFMLIGHFLNSFLLRQMEFNSDCYQIRLAGSEAFVSMIRKFHLWELAKDEFYALLEREMVHRRLPDNYSELFRMHNERLPEDVAIQVDKAIQEEQTDHFATHPSDRDRIQRAREENAAGIFHVQGQASELFADFDELGKDVTLKNFQTAFGKLFSEMQLIPSADIIRTHDELQEKQQAINRYFLGLPLNVRAFYLTQEVNGIDRDKQALIRKLKNARTYLRDHLEKAVRLFRLMHDYEIAKYELSLSKALVGSSIFLDWEVEDSVQSEPEDPEQLVLQYEEELEPEWPFMTEYVEQLRRRFQTALALLRYNDVVVNETETSAEMRRSYERLWPTFRALDDVFEDFLKLEQNYAIIKELEEWAENSRNMVRFERKLEARWYHIHQLLRMLRKKLLDVPHPYANEHNEQTVGEFLLKSLPFRNEYDEIHLSVLEMLHKFRTLYLRILGCLVKTAEHMERSMGMEPLSVPEDTASFSSLMESIFVK